MLYLIYGKQTPSLEDQHVPLLSQTFVARLTKMKTSRVNYLVNCYFNKNKKPERQSLFVPKYRAKPKGRALVTERNLTLEEFSFLTCSENLQKWAHIPLLGRCVLFHRQFPERWISRWTLSKVMRKAGLKKKTILIWN